MTQAPGRGCELYVYYRVASGQAETAAREVVAAQRGLRERWPGLEARLLERTEASSTTWMEVYRHPDGLDARQLDQLRAAMAALPTSRDGPRHEECFVPHPQGR